MGLRMKQMANGLDFGEVKDRESVKSISRHGTFQEDTNDPVKISESLEMLLLSCSKHPIPSKTIINKI
jgi:DNA polymerase IV (archaeal DinB-like DNA polymerase)